MRHGQTSRAQRAWPADQRGRIEADASMTAMVDIRTGQKTVLEYLFRPLQNVSMALRER